MESQQLLHAEPVRPIAAVEELPSVTDAPATEPVPLQSAPTRSSPRWLRIVFAIVLLAGGAAGTRYLIDTTPVPEPVPATERVWAVRTVALEFTNQQPLIEVFGEVVAGRTALLRPLVGGRIVEVDQRLLDGARVEAGTVLLSIDRFDYEAAVSDALAAEDEARARLQETQADQRNEEVMQSKVRDQLKLRRRDLARSANLSGRGLSSEKLTDEAAIAVNVAEQSLQASVERTERLGARELQAQAGVAMAAVRLARERRALGETQLVAPFAGYLADVDAAVGKRVSPSDTVARLIAADSLEARFELNDRDFARLIDDSIGPGSIEFGDAAQLVGREAQVSWEVGGRSFDYAAVIDRVGAEIDAASGGVTVVVRIRSAGGGPGNERAPLRSGAFVKVSIPDRQYLNVARVPDRAVSDDSRVFRIVGFGDAARLHDIPVVVLARVGESLLVAPASKGALRSGERIVRDVFPGVAQGIRVQPLDPVDLTEDER